jgi:hypothetical protein
MPLAQMFVFICLQLLNQQGQKPKEKKDLRDK